VAEADALQQPPIITYNLKERGRKWRGQERHFNIPKIIGAINSPETQERVKTRAMIGYYGHKVRQLAGLEPVESIVIGGKYNEVLPAIVTTYLKGYPDGRVEHKTEFLDMGPDSPGRKAAMMWKNKIGGFSSAIDETMPQFFGFDYVADPNFSTNRGFALDSAAAVKITYDSVLAEVKDEQEEFWKRLVSSKDSQLDMLSATLDSTLAENEQLMSMLLAKSGNEATITLDGVMPISVDLERTQQLRRDIDHFWNTARLPAFIDPASDDSAAEDQYNSTASRMGIKRA